MSLMRVIPLAPDDSQYDHLERLFLAAHERHPRTQSIYRESLRCFRNNTTGRLRDIDLPELQEYARRLYAMGLKASTVRLKFRVLGAFLRFARELGEERGGLDSIPPLAAVDLLPEADTVAPRLIPEDKLVQMFDLATRKERLVLGMLYFTALRRSELVGLCWRQLRDGPPGRGGYADIPPGKGGRARSVGIPEELWRELHAFRQLDAHPDEPVLGISESQLYRLVKRLGRAVGLPGLSPHWFRHTHVTHARQAGADWDIIAAQAGHGSPSVTQRIYGHLTFDTTSADVLAEVAGNLLPC